ncbi:MAG: glutamate racemase [Paludibacteraceae bacterium]|nr:glutamate racemase [Paludibacteraceae bacterium]
MKIGVFDSGYGGLTILSKIRERLPQYDYVYLGDNARTPYGTRSFEVIYAYTWQCVRRLFDEGCELVILACNTASAKALRSIQQCELLDVWKTEGSDRKRVLGVIRPTVEMVIGDQAKTPHVGVLATPGTVASQSYVIEINKLMPQAVVTQQACPMWVPLIEAGEHTVEGADFFVKKYVNELLSKDRQIDRIILGCTHYPLLYDKIRQFTPPSVKLIVQGDIVASSLADYLKRHSELERCLNKGGTCRYLTTEHPEKFSESATLFLSEPVSAEYVALK